MNIVKNEQFLQVITTYQDKLMVSCYPIDSIKVINNIDSISMIVDNEDGSFIDILTGMVVIGDKEKNSLSFRKYVLDNVSLFDKKIIDAVFNKNNSEELSLDANDFFRYYDKMKNKVIDPSDKEISVLDDGTIIEKVICSCDRTNILDKLISLDGISEESVIALICNTDIDFESEKTIVKSFDGKVLVDSFVVKAGDNVIIDDKCQLYYQFDSSCGCSKKSIECQSDIDIYKDCDFVENYGYILKISLETENNKCMIYK